MRGGATESEASLSILRQILKLVPVGVCRDASFPMTKVGTERNHAEPIASHLDTAAAEPIARLVDSPCRPFNADIVFWPVSWIYVL